MTKKEPNFIFYFMKNAATVVYYEHSKRKSIYSSTIRFSIIKQFNTIEKKGFVTMEHIPVTGDGAQMFEEQVIQAFPILVNRSGVVAMRFLKQWKRHHYVLFTQWKTEKFAEKWRRSDEFSAFDFKSNVRTQAYFPERPFQNDYYMIEEEEEEKI